MRETPRANKAMMSGGKVAAARPIVPSLAVVALAGCQSPISSSGSSTTPRFKQEKREAKRRQYPRWCIGGGPVEGRLKLIKTRGGECVEPYPCVEPVFRKQMQGEQ